MITILIKAYKEGCKAALLANDRTSASQLRRDFFFSRLLKKIRLSFFYNRQRRATLKNCSIVYRFNRGDIQSFREVFIDEVYDCPLPSRPKTFLDLGANIGLASVWIASRHPGIQIVAVEPVAENAEVVRRNVEANSINAQLVCAAVGLKDGEAWFTGMRESNLGQIVARPVVGATLVPVRSIYGLLDLFPSGCVDVVKMDIEGSEESLLEKDLQWLERVGSMIVEWHDDRSDSGPMIQRILKAGFSHERINKEHQDNLSLFVHPSLRGAVQNG